MTEFPQTLWVVIEELEEEEQGEDSVPYFDAALSPEGFAEIDEPRRIARYGLIGEGTIRGVAMIDGVDET